jgi:hypothetical protein
MGYKNVFILEDRVDKEEIVFMTNLSEEEVRTAIKDWENSLYTGYLTNYLDEKGLGDCYYLDEINRIKF